MGWRWGAGALPAAVGGVAEAQAWAARGDLTAAERKRVFGSGCSIDTAATQASAALLWGAGAELAVARAGDGAGWPEAGGGEQGTPAKDSARRLRRSAGRTPGAIFVGTVAGAHLRGGSAQVQRVRRAGARGWVHHRADPGPGVLSDIGVVNLRCRNGLCGGRGKVWIRRWLGAVSVVGCQFRIVGIVHIPLVTRIRSL